MPIWAICWRSAARRRWPMCRWSREGGNKSPRRCAARWPWPLRGELLAHYGEAGAAGGHLQWKGLLDRRPGRRAGTRQFARGRVAYVGWLSSYGLIVVLQHEKGFFTLYGHNSAVSRTAGEQGLPATSSPRPAIPSAAGRGARRQNTSRCAKERRSHGLEGLAVESADGAALIWGKIRPPFCLSAGAGAVEFSVSHADITRLLAAEL